MTDDLVSALYWMCYVTEFDVFTEDIVIKSESEDDCWGILNDTNYDEEGYEMYGGGTNEI